MKELFVQIGASRDGRDAYLSAASRRGLHSVLIETPEFLDLRSAAARNGFDSYVPITAPADVELVMKAIERLDRTPRLILAGFERYAQCAHAVSARAGLIPAGHTFQAPTKFEQRDTLRRNAPHLDQPLFWTLTPNIDSDQLLHIHYPAVLKPVNGGGGLCVYLVHDSDQLRRALKHGARLRNYDNTYFPEWITEEYLAGAESSVQGLCRNGVCDILAFCSKVIANEPINDLVPITGFREVAHIALGAQDIPAAVAQFVKDVVRGIGYRDGPFHIAFRETADGPIFIEMGFRLSGAGVSDLVRDVSGCDWGEAAFSWMLGEKVPVLSTARVRCAAMVLAFSERQIEEASRVHEDLDITIERIASPASVLTLRQKRRLAADLSRHAGPLARIHISGESPAMVRVLSTRLTTPSSQKGD